MSCVGGSRWIPLEVAAATLAAAGLIRILAAEGGIWASVIPGVWLLVPAAAVASGSVEPGEAGFRLDSWRRGWRWLLLAALLVLVPFFAAVVALRAAGVIPGTFETADLEAGEALFHLALGVVPEEIFFRGYVQSRLRAWNGRAGLHGSALAITATAALFALAHVAVEASWLRAAVFFPGLVMGWLRERTGGLLAPAGFHWLANLGWCCLWQPI